LPFVTTLPVQVDAAARPAARTAAWTSAGRAKPGAPAPTHVLYDGTAHPFGAAPLVLGAGEPTAGRFLQLSGNTAGISRRHCTLAACDGRSRVEDHSSYGTFLNGQRVDASAELQVGDRLRLGSPGIELLLIRVVDEDGSTGD
jgi:pSer/pThr/pTyr-binding forkhead associated (FHA) protein